MFGFLKRIDIVVYFFVLERNAFITARLFLFSTIIYVNSKVFLFDKCN